MTGISINTARVGAGRSYFLFGLLAIILHEAKIVLKKELICSFNILLFANISVQYDESFD